MSDVKCPNCSNALPNHELNEGWCDSCGKQIPMFVYHNAGLKGPESHVLQKTAVAVPATVVVGSDPDDAIPPWKLALSVWASSS